MVTGSLAQLQSLPKLDRSKLLEYPTLSLKERDRRWNLVRKMMKENDVHALIVIQGVRREDNPANYFTNEPIGSSPFVFFPLSGEPFAFGARDLLVVDTFMKSEAYGIKSWVKDWRFGPSGMDDWVNELKKRGLSSARIGIIGKGTFSSHSQALIANTITNAIKTALPKVTFVELWRPFVDIMLIKSQEEIAMFRKAALVLEVASEEFVWACKPGARVADIENAFMIQLSLMELKFGL